MIVVVATIVFGLRAAIVARKSNQPSAHETPYVALTAQS
jgi:hypothetical protein